MCLSKVRQKKSRVWCMWCLCKQIRHYHHGWKPLNNKNNICYVRKILLLVQAWAREWNNFCYYIDKLVPGLYKQQMWRNLTTGRKNYLSFTKSNPLESHESNWFQCKMLWNGFWSIKCGFADQHFKPKVKCTEFFSHWIGSVTMQAKLLDRENQNRKRASSWHS